MTKFEFLIHYNLIAETIEAVFIKILRGQGFQLEVLRAR